MDDSLREDPCHAFGYLAPAFFHRVLPEKVLQVFDEHLRSGRGNCDCAYTLQTYRYQFRDGVIAADLQDLYPEL